MKDQRSLAELYNTYLQLLNIPIIENQLSAS